MHSRVSQRPSFACRECTRAKRRCDKQSPCSRCSRLGLDCAREVVHLRRHLTKNAAELDFLTSLRDDLQSSHPNRISKAIRQLTERIQSLQSGQASDASSWFSDSNDPLANITSTSSDADAPTKPDGENLSIVTALEHLAWGRNYGSCYPHRRCACQYSRTFSPLNSVNTIQSLQMGASFQLPAAAAAAQLPSRPDAETLVCFHLSHLMWHHGCVHSSRFLQQCRTFWNTGSFDQPQWLALYCAVLATSLFCLQNSRKHQDAYPLLPNTYSAAGLFDLMIELLYSSDFLRNMSLYSVQAIVISTEVAHNLGLSQLNATLFSAAVRIAECLGLHKIENSKPTSSLNAHEEEWQENVDKEVGRRVWCQMVIQDHFAIPFTDSYIIHPSHYSTGLPENADDSDLVAKPSGVPTIATYIRVLNSIAQLMPELANGMGPLNDRKPAHRQYEHVLRMDQKMRHAVRMIPSFLLRQDAVLEAQVPWLGIARQSLAITSAEKIIMIHRPFIFRSFQSIAYGYTRRTCVSASITILREHQNIENSGELSLWTHTAFCITAALILCFEVMCTENQTEREGKGSVSSHKRSSISDVGRRQAYNEAIQGARQRLSKRKNDILAQRGVLLINALIPEHPSDDSEGHGLSSKLPDANNIDFVGIVAKFTADWAILECTTDTPGLTTTMHLNNTSNFEDISMTPAEDFDVWFNNLFTTDDGVSF